MRSRYVPGVLVLGASLVSGAACTHRPLHVEEVRGGTLATFRAAESIRSLTDPALLEAEEAVRRFGRDQPVVGTVVGGVPVAVALSLLDRHEIVNVDLNGVGGVTDPRSRFAATW